MGGINTVLWLEDGGRGGWLVLVRMCVLGSGRLHSTRDACVGRGCICIPVNCCMIVFSVIIAFNTVTEGSVPLII